MQCFEGSVSTARYMRRSEDKDVTEALTGDEAGVDVTEEVLVMEKETAAVTSCRKMELHQSVVEDRRSRGQKEKSFGMVLRCPKSPIVFN